MQCALADPPRRLGCLVVAVVVDVGAKLRAGVRAGVSVRVGVRLSVRFLRLGFGGRARVGARLGRMFYVRRACVGAGVTRGGLREGPVWGWGWAWRLERRACMGLG